MEENLGFSQLQNWTRETEEDVLHETHRYTSILFSHQNVGSIPDCDHGACVLEQATLPKGLLATGKYKWVSQ